MKFFLVASAATAVLASTEAVPEMTEVDGELRVNVAFIEQFLAGIAEGVFAVNHLNKINVCFKDLTKMAVDLPPIIADLKSKSLAKIPDALMHVGNILIEAPRDFNDCRQVQHDFARISAWLAPIKADPKTAGALMWANIMANYVPMIHDLDLMNQALAKNNIRGAGQDVAEILKLGMGPIKSEAPVELEAIEMTQW